MSFLVRLRRAIGRVLPAPVKRILRAVLPARLIHGHPATRQFWLSMPTPPAGLGPRVRSVPAPARVRMEAPWPSYVPRLLQDNGVAGYEPDTMAAFLAAISVLDADEAFDIGANVGVFAIVASVTTTAHVTGFEPTPQLATTYRRVAAVNGLACDIEEIALGARGGTATLYISAKTDSSNSLAPGFRPARDSVEVPIERLDDYIARTGRRPAVMKMDTESTEPDVLAGGLQTLVVVRPWIICEVLASQTEARLMDILRPLGYQFHHLGADGPTLCDEIVGDTTYRFRDWLFTPAPLLPAFGGHYAAWRAALLATS